KGDQFLELLRLVRAKQKIGRLLVRLKEVKPPFAKDVVAAHLESETITALVIVGVDFGGKSHLPEVVDAGNGFGFLLGFRQGRQEKGRENGNDGDDNQQLDKSEATRRFHGVRTRQCAWPAAAATIFFAEQNGDTADSRRSADSFVRAVFWRND